MVAGKKISKSDQDPHQVDRDRAALAAMSEKKCQHFTKGSFVVYNRERCEVLAVHEGLGVMAIRYPDGTWELIQPFALQ